MIRLALLALLGCGKDAALVPYDTTIGANHGGPPIDRINHEGVEEYRGGKYREAADKFRWVVGHVPDGRYFFNLCLALTKLDDLTGACATCGYARTHSDGDARLLDHATRQLAQIEALAKQPCKTDPP